MNIRTHRVLARARLGFRGAFLLCLALIDLVYGWSLVNPSAEVMRGAAFAWRNQFMPTQSWGVIWISVGVFLISQAWSRRDRAAFSVALAIKFVWSLIAFCSWGFGAVEAGYALGTIFFVFGALTFIASRWPEPIMSHTVTVMSEGDGDIQGLSRD